MCLCALVHSNHGNFKPGHCNNGERQRSNSNSFGGVGLAIAGSR